MWRDRLGGTTEPWLRVFVASRAEFANSVRIAERAEPRFIARVVRGHKSPTVAALLDEFAAAWQFPWYFGENWDALAECLTDLNWLPANGYLLAIDQAVRLLDCEPDAEFATLFQVLERAFRAWYFPELDARPGRPFHVVLQCEPETRTALASRLAAAGVGFHAHGD